MARGTGTHERAILCEESEERICGLSRRLPRCVRRNGISPGDGGYGPMPAGEIAHDIEYIESQGTEMDSRMTLETLAVLVSHEGAR